jgi:hypothetical protein
VAWEFLGHLDVLVGRAGRQAARGRLRGGALSAQRLCSHQAHPSRPVRVRCEQLQRARPLLRQPDSLRVRHGLLRSRLLEAGCRHRRGTA